MSGKRNRRRGRAPSPHVDPLFLHELTGRSSARDNHHKPDHKARMIARQAYEALSFALGEGGDEALIDVWVESVEPAPNAGRLAVRIALVPGAQATLPGVMEALDRHHGRLRAAVAAAITRKRAPELVFIPVLPAEGGVA